MLLAIPLNFAFLSYGSLSPPHQQQITIIVNMNTNNRDSLTLLTEPDAIDQYKRQLVRFMSWKHGKPISFSQNNIVFNANDIYPTHHDFTTEELLAITPEDIVKWMSIKAYHKLNPSKRDEPIYATQNSLKYTKKALSYFMVHSPMMWNDVTKFGNPTKSKKVNALIGIIGKMETSDRGKPSNADRAFEYKEVAEVMRIFFQAG